MGIDSSKEMIKIAQKKVPEANFIIQDMRNLDFAKNSFDGISFSYSLFHIEKKSVLDVLKKTHEILKDNGVIILIMQEGEGEIVIDEPLMPELKIYFNLYTQPQITKVLKETGFEVLSIDRIPPDEEEIPYNKMIILAKKR